jgi:hypothetical protein
MAEAVAAMLDRTVNCCNGRVGRELLDIAEKNAMVRELIAPIGVELMRRAAAANLLAKDTVNCCNGRVGRAAMEELVTALGGA